MLHNQYRLHGNPLERKQGDKVPRKIFWVSAEGAVTEHDYLKGISSYRDKLGILSVVDVETLKRKKRDGKCSPEDIQALLDECIYVRGKELHEILTDLDPRLHGQISVATINAYLEGSLSKKEKKTFEDAIRLFDIDLKYLGYLQKRSSEEDEFCIVIDRDKESHTEESIRACNEWCQEHAVHFFLSNPCFEFWMLLHFKDIAHECSPEQLGQFLENERVSENHTFTSRFLSDVHLELAGIGQGKHIRNFDMHYLPRVDDAIRNARAFAQSFPQLLNELGTSMPLLIALLRQQKDEER